jgi:hypothetical protein
MYRAVFHLGLTLSGQSEPKRHRSQETGAGFGWTALGGRDGLPTVKMGAAGPGGHVPTPNAANSPRRKAAVAPRLGDAVFPKHN